MDDTWFYLVETIEPIPDTTILILCAAVVFNIHLAHIFTYVRIAVNIYEQIGLHSAHLIVWKTLWYIVIVCLV